jgi:hypothetical protein
MRTLEAIMCQVTFFGLLATPIYDFRALVVQPFERLDLAVTRHALESADAMASVEFAGHPLVGIGCTALLHRVGNGCDCAGDFGDLRILDRRLRMGQGGNVTTLAECLVGSEMGARID